MYNILGAELTLASMVFTVVVFVIANAKLIPAREGALKELIHGLCQLASRGINLDVMIQGPHLSDCLACLLSAPDNDKTCQCKG
jgi:hypothetical protein